MIYIYICYTAKLSRFIRFFGLQIFYLIMGGVDMWNKNIKKKKLRNGRVKTSLEIIHGTILTFLWDSIFLYIQTL